MKYKWSQYPKAQNELIKLFRNFCSYEFSSEYVYESGPHFKDWEMHKVFDWIDKNCNKELYESFENIYRKKQEENSMFPKARSVHDYLKKYDSSWYKEVYESNYNKM